MKLHEQIKEVSSREQDDINRVKFGEVKFIIQDGKAIRSEITVKKNIK